MFQWYARADVCCAFLMDVTAEEDHGAQDSRFRRSYWFTRGWTLQELIAPARVVARTVRYHHAYTVRRGRSRIPTLTGEDDAADPGPEPFRGLLIFMDALLEAGRRRGTAGPRIWTTLPLRALLQPWQFVPPRPSPLTFRKGWNIDAVSYDEAVRRLCSYGAYVPASDYTFTPYGIRTVARLPLIPLSECFPADAGIS